MPMVESRPPLTLTAAALVTVTLPPLLSAPMPTLYFRPVTEPTAPLSLTVMVSAPATTVALPAVA